MVVCNLVHDLHSHRPGVYNQRIRGLPVISLHLLRPLRNKYTKHRIIFIINMSSTTQKSAIVSGTKGNMTEPITVEIVDAPIP